MSSFVNDPEPPRSTARWDLFWWGAVAWFLFNVALGGIGSVVGGNGGAFGALALLLNLGWLGYFGVTRPWFALGALGCIGIVIGLVLLAGIFIAVTCGSRL